MGGLGNQLFQYCAGVYLETVIGCRVTHTGQLLEEIQIPSIERRQFLIESLIPELSRERWSRWRIGSSHVMSNITNPYFRREILPSDESLKQVGSRTRFVSGYFQREEYVSAVWLTLLERFGQSRVFSQILEPSVSDSLVIHVRLGDFLNSSVRKFHGLTHLEYFERAYCLLSEMTQTSKVLVISDSLPKAQEFLSDSEVFRLAPVQFVDSPDEFQTLRLMTWSRGVVASNSSFSWWGGRLCWALNQGHVVVPTPWFVKPGNADKFLHPVDSRWVIISRLLERG
jgi:hypothetical protein